MLCIYNQDSTSKPSTIDNLVLKMQFKVATLYNMTKVGMVNYRAIKANGLEGVHFLNMQIKRAVIHKS